MRQLLDTFLFPSVFRARDAGKVALAALIFTLRAAKFSVAHVPQAYLSLMSEKQRANTWSRERLLHLEMSEHQLLQIRYCIHSLGILYDAF